MILPALMLSNRLAGVAVELAQDGLGVTPLWGGAGGVVQVSNVVPEGKPEIETIQRVSDACAGVVQREKSVRKMLLSFLCRLPVPVSDQSGDRRIGNEFL